MKVKMGLGLVLKDCGMEIEGGVDCLVMEMGAVGSVSECTNEWGLEGSAAA